jgi:hypothetical protein
VGRGRYYQKKYGNDLHGIYVFGNDSQAARDATFASVAALRDIGIKSDGDFDRSARATQSEYTEIVQAMKTAGSNYGQCTSSFPCTVLLRKEAALQGLTGIKVWDCGSACYDQQFLASGGQDVEGQYVDTTFLPFLSKADQKANKMAANFVKYTGADKAASFGAYTWAAGIAFRDAVNSIVKTDGVNGVTRKSILAALGKIQQFDAEGMIGTIDLAGRKVSACDVTLQVKNGEFVRVNPTKPGTYSCSPKNVITRSLDLIKG